MAHGPTNRRQPLPLHRRYVLLGEHQSFPGNPDDTLIRATTRRGRQLCGGFRRNVATNDGEVAGVQFKNVGATRKARCLYTVRMRVRAEASNEVHGNGGVSLIASQL